jgi:hypothetical protein
VWQCSDFNSDGTHPSAQGRMKVANMLLSFVHSEPTAASWYLAQPVPAAYGVGKPTTIATLPSVGWTGTPSFASANFAVTFSNGIPGGVGLGLFGPQPDDVPFVNATRWVASPFMRLSVQSYDASGHVSYPIAITPQMVGTTRFYQGYLRDVAQPDGTGAAVSDGLRVVFWN